MVIHGTPNGILCSHKKRERMPFAARGCGLEGYYAISYAQSENQNKLMNKTQKKQTQGSRRETNGYQSWGWQCKDGEWEVQISGCETVSRVYIQ